MDFNKKIGKKFVKVCLHSRQIMQISLQFDDFFFDKIKAKKICESLFTF